MKNSQVITIFLLFAFAGPAAAEISGSGHQIQGCTGVIRSLVWHDANRNGIQDAGEAPLAHVELQLERVADPQLGADVLRTDSSGHVRFYNLCLQDHLLRVAPATLPPGMTPTTVNVGAEQRDVLDSDGGPGFAPVRIELDDYVSVVETVDFGFAGPQCEASVGDRVWLDEDANTLQDAFESGLAGIRLRLEDDAGNVVANATTDRQGGYRFGGLCPDAYTVTLDDMPAEFAASAPEQGDDTAIDGQDVRHTLQVDESDDSVDFGLHRPGCTGAIAGTVFDDGDLSGERGDDEEGLAGVALYVDSANGYRQYALSDEDGRFELRGLCAGTYALDVDTATLPLDALPTTAPALPRAVVLAADDAQVESGSAGYSTSCAGRIGDRVWLDQDGDGLQGSDETGFPGVAILLRDSLGNALGQRVTDANGGYLFGALCAGDYALQVDAGSLPAGFVATQERAGDPASDSDGVAPVWVTLGANVAADLTIDFGYQPPQTPMLRLDTECHPLSPESQEFDCDDPISELSMTWRGHQTVKVVAYLGDADDDVLTVVRDIQPGQRVEIDGYDDGPKDVLWRVFDEATGAHLGDSWFYMSCGDKDMDGPEDCGKMQGDGKGGEHCDDGCLMDWALDGLLDKKRRLRCTGDDVVPNQQCTAEEDSVVFMQHVLKNLGGSSAEQVALHADYETTLGDDYDVALGAGASISFGGLADVAASSEYTVSASCDTADGDCGVSRSTAVSATPRPDCSVYGLSRLKKDDDKIKWKLANRGREDTTISRIDVSWPDAHGDLKEIKRGGDKIVDRETPARSASFDEPMLHHDRNKRRLERDKAEDIEIKFKEKSRDRRDQDYAITVHFEEGCSVTLTP